MSTTKPTFKTINFGAMDAADKFAKANNVPDIVFPDQAGVGVSPEPPAPAVVTSLSLAARPRKPKQPEPALPSPIRRLHVELPDYLVRAIGDKAHATQTTNRYVITQALQKAGFYVAAEDLKEDGRRVR
jgi:hypothetical protein